MPTKACGPAVAVIGAGVSGLVAARRLAAEGLQVTIYERRKLPGGVWNYTKDADPATPDGLQMSAWTQWNGSQGSASGRLSTTFSSAVTTRGGWKLTFRDVSTKWTITKDFSAVVVAVGVFDKPFWPNLAGLRSWGQQWPGSLSHSKTYRNPKPFHGKKVVTVGYGASGFGIAQKLTGHASQIWVSTSNAEQVAQLPRGAKMMPRLVGLDPYGRKSLYFEHYRRLTGVDCVIFCTGYSYHQPFLRGDAYADAPLFPEGPALDELHEHVLCTPNPSRAFVGLVKGDVPTFLLVQAQAAFVSRVWKGRGPLRLDAALTADELAGHPPPSSNNNNSRDEDYKELVCHELPYPKFMDYLLRLERTCLEVDGKLKARMNRRYYRQNLPFRWTMDHEWVLQHRRQICTQFLSFDEQAGRGINSLQQLYRAPTEEQWQALQMKKYEGVLRFLILHAGYFECQAQTSPELPRITVQLEDPPVTLTYISPAYLRTMSTFLYDCWRDLRCDKS